MSFENCLLKILFIFWIFLLKFVTCDYNETDALTEKSPIKTRIAGGYRPANHLLAKYIVSLRLKGEGRRHFGYTHFCGGSIIASNIILTAAHCVYKDNPNLPSFKVVAKTPIRLTKTDKTQEIFVRKVLVHPKYKDETLLNDIALLFLSENISLDSTFAETISLPKQNTKAGTICQVIGWGRLYLNGPLANDLLYTDLHLHSGGYCRTKFPGFSSTKLCASNIQDTEMDACSGDSGGPLICSGVITGIVSYGYGCAWGHAGVYTNVFQYIHWIESSAALLIMPCLFNISIYMLIIVILK